MLLFKSAFIYGWTRRTNIAQPSSQITSARVLETQPTSNRNRLHTFSFGPPLPSQRPVSSSDTGYFDFLTVMSRLASFFLCLIHAIYALTSLTSSLREYFAREAPTALTVRRKQVPKHVAILLASDNDSAPSEAFEQQILQNVENVVAWCQVVGIQRLTFYDRKGAFHSRGEQPTLFDDIVGLQGYFLGCHSKYGPACWT